MTTTSPFLKATSLAVLLTTAPAALAQRFAVTNITVPGTTSLSIAAQNNNGDVAGYCITAASEQRAFRWADGNGVDLGTLGGSTSVGNALNNFGQVVGYASSIGDAQFHGFFAIGHTLFDLSTLGGSVSSASAVSDSGHTTGYSTLSTLSLDSHAFLSQNGSALQDLGTLGGSTSSGSAVNNLGQVAGDSTTLGDAETHAFLFRNGVMNDLGTLGGTYSSASALNDAGDVAGDSSLAGEVDWHAFLYRNGQMHDLGTLGGTFSSAYGINDAGQVIGDSTLLGDTEFHAVLFSNGDVIDLGSLGGHFSTAWALNNHGQVVGVSSNANGQARGFLWQDNTMVDLNSRLPANSGWEITSAYFINDAGQIVGQGYHQGQLDWYQLTPQPNQPPVADAGADQTVNCSASVALDGSASNDPDGDVLTYEWLEGNVSLGNTAQLSLSLNLGSHTLTLRVSDPSGQSAEDSVTVNVVDTTPPSVVCPAPRSSVAGENGTALVPDLLSDLTATDGCAAADSLSKIQTPAAGTSLPPGEHHISIQVADPSGNAATCSVTFTVTSGGDTTPPVLCTPEEMVRRARLNCMGVVPAVPYRVRDNATPASQIVVTQDPAPGTWLESGRHEIHMTARDLAGNVTNRTVVLHIADVCKPIFQSLTVSTNSLRPVNRQMIEVTLTAVATDNCDASPECHIVSVCSSDPVMSQSDNTGPDWEITGPMSVALRAEVSSSAQSRVYSIRVACTDSSGNTTYRKACVRASRNQNSE